MAFIRATYDGSTVTSVDDSSTLAANYTKYWTNEHGVADSPGVWCTTANKYIPDEWYDEEYEEDDDYWYKELHCLVQINVAS